MQRSILSGVLSVAGTKVLTLIVGLLTTPILYRLLQPEGVGVYTTVLSVFSLFMILVSSGVADGVRKFLAEDRDMDCWEENVVGFYFRLAFSLSVAGAIVLALATWVGLVEKVFGPGFELYFYVLTILVITDQFRAYSRRTLMGFGLERYSEPLKVLQQLAFVAVAIPLVHFGFGVNGALAGKIAAGGVVTVAGLTIIARRTSLRGVFRTTPEKFPRRTMLTFNSLSVVLIFLLMSLYHVDILMLQLISGSKQVGYYRAALKLAEFLWFIPLALQTVFVHSTSELWSNDKTEKISKLAARTTRYTFLLTGIMSIGLAALANVAVPVYFSSDFTPAITPLLLLLPGTLGFAVARPILAIAQGKGNLKYPIIATGVAAGINLILNLILIPRFGMHGAAIATSMGYGSMFVFHLWSARRIGFDPLSDARLGRVIATTVLSAPPIFVLAQFLDVRPELFGIEVPLSLVLVPPLGFIVFLFFAFAMGALGVCEVLNTLSSFPEPVGSRAETLQANANNDTMSSDSIQKMMIVAGILLFISGIGYAFLNPGLGGLGGSSDPAPTTQPPTNTTATDTITSTTPPATTAEETKPPESTTRPPSTTPPEETAEPTETSSTTQPSTTPEETTQPSTTSTTQPPTTTSEVTTQPSTTSTTQPSTTTTQPPTTSTTQPSTTTSETTTQPSTTSPTTTMTSSSNSTTEAPGTGSTTQSSRTTTPLSTTTTSLSTTTSSFPTIATTTLTTTSAQ
ncbi:oligosaccharide flippase family protein [Haladaptatus caseinilyticus]|uniref:oligosaccharide flippase family protein n=1 Tax=Haladaptatus caseinilyticus TaxID=2993314 RepID=UPI002E239DFA